MPLDDKVEASNYGWSSAPRDSYKHEATKRREGKRRTGTGERLAFAQDSV